MRLSKFTFATIFACIFVCGTGLAAPKCSKVNLTRCLDSVCAINIGVNPAARCQYCGTSSAGEPPTTKGLTNVTAGQSTKYAISAKELATVPSDPGRRYIWATTECIKKVAGCTPDDVSTAYDRLIEQSCKSAGVSIQIANTIKNLDTKPTKTKCTETLNVCMNQKCGAGFDSCKTDADFDRVIAECATDATGCDEYVADFRKSASAERERIYANRENSVQSLVTGYKTTRENRLINAQNACNTKTASSSCVKTVCANNMPGKCDGDTEKAMATQLCKFYDTACTVLK